SYLNYKWEPILAVTLKESIAKSTAGLYKLEFKEIHLNLLSGKFRIKDLHIIPDMEKYHQLKKLNNTPAYLYTIQLKEFTISNYNPFDLYFNQTLDIYSVTMYEPEIEVINFVNKPKQAGDSIYRSPYDLIKNILKGVYINHIHLINSKV